jgi:hypothetical protein
MVSVDELEEGALVASAQGVDEVGLPVGPGGGRATAEDEGDATRRRPLRSSP